MCSAGGKDHGECFVVVNEKQCDLNGLKHQELGGGCMPKEHCDHSCCKNDIHGKIVVALGFSPQEMMAKTQLFFV